MPAFARGRGRRGVVNCVIVSGVGAGSADLRGMREMAAAMICPKTQGRKVTFLGVTSMPKYNHLGPTTARQILSVVGALEGDFQRLSSNQVSRLLSYADEYGYRTPSGVAGSRGQRWHAYLLRRASQNETRGVATWNALPDP